jgi:Uma2 family endonuclease
MNLAAKLLRPATFADLHKIPPTWRGEVIDGTLYAFPRPYPLHANIKGLLTAELNNAFDRGRSGPGGWRILGEPGIQHPRAPEYSPDLAGWRRERLPQLPRNKTITVVPDWVCEILSPTTGSYDQTVKRRFYAEIGVAYLWYIAPDYRSLTVSKVENGKWLELGVHGRDEKVHAEPFEAIEINLAEWWEGIEEEEEPESE